MPATAYNASAPTSSGRRPSRSATAPDSGALIAIASDVIVNASRTSTSAPAKATAIAGRLGAISAADMIVNPAAPSTVTCAARVGVPRTVVVLTTSTLAAAP